MDILVRMEGDDLIHMSKVDTYAAVRRRKVPLYG